MFSRYIRTVWPPLAEWVCCLTDGYSSHFAVNKCVQIDGRKLRPNCCCTKYNVSFRIYIKLVWCASISLPVSPPSHQMHTNHFNINVVRFISLVWFQFVSNLIWSLLPCCCFACSTGISFDVRHGLVHAKCPNNWSEVDKRKCTAGARTVWCDERTSEKGGERILRVLFSNRWKFILKRVKSVRKRDE